MIDSIHWNPNLSTIDKFSYLLGFVEEPAKTAIAVFALTLANYEAPLDLLKRRFGRKENIQKSACQQCCRELQRAPE